MNFLTRFFGLTKDVSLEQLKNITLLFWSGVILLLVGEMVLLIGAASNSGSIVGVMPYLATATVAFPLLLVVAIHWGLMRGLLALGYGGEKPQEAFVQGWSNAVRVIAYLAFANIVAIAPLMALSVRHVIPAYMSLILILIGIGIGAVAHGVTSRALWRIGSFLLLVIVGFLVIVWISPETGRSINSLSTQSPYLVQGRAKEGAILAARREARLQSIAQKIERCEMTAVELAAKDGACSITREDLELWQDAANSNLLEKSKDAATSAVQKAKHWLGTDAGEKNSATERAARKKIVRPAGCRVNKEFSAAGDEIWISFPNCWAGPWETDLPGSLNWTCDFDRDVKIEWKFGKGGETGEVSPLFSILGANAKDTEEFSYPMDGIKPFGLHMDVQNKKITLQWNVELSKTAPNQGWWGKQKGSVLIRCSAML